MLQAITGQQPKLQLFIPALISTGIAWFVYILLGETPFIRASGLALVIAGVTLTLSQWGNVQSIIGGLTLAFSPIFWGQATISATDAPATIVIALVVALVIVGGIAIIKRPYLALVAGFIVFAVIFWSQVGTPRSVRLTSLLTAWILFVLIDVIRITTPRPDEPSGGVVDRPHTYGILILFILGVINDPLFTLLAPALLMALWLARAPVNQWYWAVFLLFIAWGLRGIAVTYIDPDWWTVSAFEADQNTIRVPYILADGWRAGGRWVDVLDILIKQFTLGGVFLSVLGLARMARWYPLLGVTTMIAFGFYTLFGLMYFGNDREILLLPLLIIQVIWLTYAIHAIGQWLDRTFAPHNNAHLIATGLYAIIPAYLLLNNLA